MSSLNDYGQDKSWARQNILVGELAMSGGGLVTSLCLLIFLADGFSWNLAAVAGLAVGAVGIGMLQVNYGLKQRLQWVEKHRGAMSGRRVRRLVVQRAGRIGNLRAERIRQEDAVRAAQEGAARKRLEWDKRVRAIEDEHRRYPHREDEAWVERYARAHAASLLAEASVIRAEYERLDRRIRDGEPDGFLEYLRRDHPALYRQATWKMRALSAAERRQGGPSDRPLAHAVDVAEKHLGENTMLGHDLKRLRFLEDLAAEVPEVLENQQVKEVFRRHGLKLE
ncbi:MAG: hypothetical protein WA005_11300 [Candidatus Binataceae bacterium]